MKPVILTDVDGVVIKWQSGLPFFAQKYNLPLQHILDLIIDDKFVAPEVLFDCDKEMANKLMDKYNSSDFIRYLSPYSDALDIINQLKKTYDFVAITALGDSIDSLLNRQFNLNALFPGAFKDIYVCNHHESKEDLFKRAKEKYGSRIVGYIDDMPHHVDMAKSVFPNLPIYWMPRAFREKSPASDHCRVENWNNISWLLASNLQYPASVPAKPVPLPPYIQPVQDIETIFPHIFTRPLRVTDIPYGTGTPIGKNPWITSTPGHNKYKHSFEYYSPNINCKV